MATRSNSETRRVRYLLGVSSPAQREHIESEYFEDEDAFAEMLATEDDLIDAYARGELAGEEQRRFEKSFVNSLRRRDRVRFAHAFADSVSATQSIETKLPGTWLDIFNISHSPRLSRTVTIAAVIVFVAVLAWLVIDRSRITNELRELRAESTKLRKQTETLQRSTDTEQTRTAEIAAQLAGLRAHPDKQRHRVSTTTTNGLEIKITELPIQGRKFSNLLTLQPAPPLEGNVVAGRADQTGVTLYGVDVEPLNTYSPMPRNMNSGGGTTVRGTVRDPNGNLVSGANVTLTNPARNFTRTQSTNENGAYVFNAILPGTYSLEVNAAGFKSASASVLTALVNPPPVWDVQLEVGAVSETVDVTSAAAAPINTSDASLGNSFERKRITELLLNANNVVSLLSLQPAVSRKGSVNGRRADHSNITLNGVDVTTIRIPNALSWIRFQIALETAAMHEEYNVTIRTADSRLVTSVNWTEPFTPNQTLLDTPVISTGDLPSGDYVLLLMGKEPNGSFVKMEEYSFKVIKD